MHVQVIRDAIFIPSPHLPRTVDRPVRMPIHAQNAQRSYTKTSTQPRNLYIMTAPENTMCPGNIRGVTQCGEFGVLSLRIRNWNTSRRSCLSRLSPHLGKWVWGNGDVHVLRMVVHRFEGHFPYGIWYEANPQFPGVSFSGLSDWTSDMARGKLAAFMPHAL